MDKIWFIADLHFGHKNIIAYENRPYSSVKEMDKELIKNWNSVVQPDDSVFVLGDFSFYGKEKTSQICARLRGRKILVLGNHDGESEEYYRECGFYSAYRNPIIFKGFWMLSHEPLYTNTNMPYANIFGHVHGSATYKDYGKQSFCACVERINYTPIDFEEIKKRVLEA